MGRSHFKAYNPLISNNHQDQCKHRFSPALFFPFVLKQRISKIPVEHRVLEINGQVVSNHRYILNELI